MLMHDLVDEGVEEQVESTQEAVHQSDWVQTLVAIPLIAATAAAVFMLIPNQNAIVTMKGSFENSEVSGDQLGYGGHDRDERHARLMMARMESDRARARSQSRRP